MKRGAKNAYKSLGKGSISYDTQLLGKLKPGEMESLLMLIQTAAQSMMDIIPDQRRVMLLSYGNPAVVEIDLSKLKRISYEDVRLELRKLVDIQRKAAMPIDDEAARLDRLLGR